MSDESTIRNWIRTEIQAALQAQAAATNSAISSSARTTINQLNATYASETVFGMAKLATQTEAESLSNDLAVLTPLKFDYAFAKKIETRNSVSIVSLSGDGATVTAVLSDATGSLETGDIIEVSGTAYHNGTYSISSLSPFQWPSTITDSETFSSYALATWKYSFGFYQ